MNTEETVPQYRSKPQAMSSMPPGIPYIIGNEAAERFSFYGMKTILVVFMTKFIADRTGHPAPMGEEQAKTWFHLFSSAVYFTPIFGAILADAFLGKYKTILNLSIIYCLGHLALALDDTQAGLAVGLTLIAIGSGGIKPCVSAHVGDQFGEQNKHLVPSIFNWFYFSINFGAFFSTLMTPWLLENYGPHWAFGIPGILMFLATFVFWLGRNKFVHIPPAGTSFLRDTFSLEGLKILGRLSIIYAFVAMFWSLYDQTGSAWVLQAAKMDVQFLSFMGIHFDEKTAAAIPSQIQAINPILIMVLIAAFTFIYPVIDKFWRLTPLRKIGVGFFMMIPAFLIPAYCETLIAAGLKPTIWYQIVAYLLLTIAEILVSITALEFSYTQAKNSMKSMVMALYLMSVSMGNLFTAAVNYLIQNDDGSSKLTGAQYYLFFAGAMLITALIYIPVALRYREKSYYQEAV
ncbi:MAG: POT family MFS transporter [Bdellovibrionales bacterium]|nr:POT family MFS transporter [Bdellovibrionales bacterium]